MAKYLRLCFLAIVLLPVAANSQESSGKPTLQCDVGPLHKTYGKVEWLVYSCSDNKTLVIISAPGSPAMPFYFTFFPKGNGYDLAGEGEGNKAVTDAAYSELKIFSAAEIAALITETKRQRR